MMKLDLSGIARALGLTVHDDESEDMIEVCEACGKTEVIYCGLSGQDKLPYCNECHVLKPKTTRIVESEYLRRNA